LGPGILSYGLDGPADVYVVKRKMTRTGFEARIQTPAGAIDIRTALLGDINVYNTLAAVAAASVLGLPLVVIEAGLAGAAGAPGRLERVGRQDDFLVLVDYAHSPDALARALSVARGLEPHRLISIFGCGGDRDRTKRPLMARAAGELSDLAILTSDNPRTEDPLSIIGMAEPGLVQIGGKRVDIQDLTPEFEPGSYAVQPDRREAIGLAVRLMKPGDIVVVTGKGHEDYQVLGTTKIHFDDREEAAAALKRENRF
jgi:UDP-N-acetylmuramoyl-L-alanyl-D-glutamate--2,6-diaminopimelate ligase